MSAKLFLNPSIKFIPQMDFEAKTTENGGIEATQSFLARRSDLGSGTNLSPFTRGTLIELLDPNVPVLYKGLTVKTFPHEDHAPGVIKINVTFTGYQFSINGSSGNEPEVPTSSLRGGLEDTPITKHPKWIALTKPQRKRLSWLMTRPDIVSFNIETSEYGKLENYEFTAFPTDPGIWVVPTGDELVFAEMIAEGEITYRHPSWDYNYRTEASKGFTQQQLASLGKIVANPPGDPVKPGSGWTWQLVGPSQDQSGPKRFIKELSFMLIADNPRNQTLYGA